MVLTNSQIWKAPVGKQFKITLRNLSREFMKLHVKQAQAKNQKIQNDEKSSKLIKEYCKIMSCLHQMHVIGGLVEEFTFFQNQFLMAPYELWDLKMLNNLLPSFELKCKQMHSIKLLHKLQNVTTELSNGLEKIEWKTLTQLMILST